MVGCLCCNDSFVEFDCFFITLARWLLERFYTVNLASRNKPHNLETKVEPCKAGTIASVAGSCRLSLGGSQHILNNTAFRTIGPYLKKHYFSQPVPNAALNICPPSLLSDLLLGSIPQPSSITLSGTCPCQGFCQEWVPFGGGCRWISSPTI